MFLQQVINSLMIGSLYALTAMGATLIYGILGILDIANAGAYLLGAYVGYYVYTAASCLPFLWQWQLSDCSVWFYTARSMVLFLPSRVHFLSFRWSRRSAFLPSAATQCV